MVGLDDVGAVVWVLLSHTLLTIHGSKEGLLQVSDRVLLVSNQIFLPPWRHLDGGAPAQAICLLRLSVRKACLSNRADQLYLWLEN